MYVSDKELNAPQGNVGQGSDDRQRSRLRIIAAVVGLVSLLAGGVRWSQLNAGTAQKAAPQPKAEAQVAPAAFEYFPAQYVNQAKEVEEHIQAF